MKFWIGFLTGAAISGYIVSGMTPERRRSVATTMSKATDKVRNSSVADAVSSGASDVASAASDRVASVIDRGASTVETKIEPTVEV